MTISGALSELNNLLKSDSIPFYYKPVIKKVIETIEQELIVEWIPISERLPEDDTEVIVSCTDDSGDSEFSYTTIGWHYKGMWIVSNNRNYFVKAWMSLPTSYKEIKE